MSFSGSFRALSKSNDISGVESNLVRNAILTASGTLTYTSIAASSSQDQTIALSGGVVGDIIMTGSSVLAPGLLIRGFVSVANVVTVRITNSTAGALVPGAVLVNVIAIKL